jgi:hypothetical protein
VRRTSGRKQQPCSFVREGLWGSAWAVEHADLGVRQGLRRHDEGGGALRGGADVAQRRMGQTRLRHGHASQVSPTWVPGCG